ncbi:unnamed protein product [Pylaiella littoralis]
MPLATQQFDGAQAHNALNDGADLMPPHNHAALAWLSCLLCCWPIGLLAIYFSRSVNQKWGRGDFEGAYQASDNTKRASAASITVGCIILVIKLFVLPPLQSYP